MESKKMKHGGKFSFFIEPPYPKQLSILGNYVRLEPLDSYKNGRQLYNANKVRNEIKIEIIYQKCQQKY